MSYVERTRVADFWDGVLDKWRGDPTLADLPAPLHRWRQSYRGDVDLTCYPDAFVGDLRGEASEPQLIVLGLNPGVAYSDLQGATGEWTHAIRRLTYSRSSQQRVPYNNDAWNLRHGKKSSYWGRLVNFAKRWLQKTRATPADIINFEMFPFHSKGLTHRIAPPRDIVDSFVWKPLSEMKAPVVFAFGSDWVPVCVELLGKSIAQYGDGGRQLRDTTNGNWQVNVFPLAEKRIIVSWQRGYAGPPGPGNTDELRRVVRDALS